jgi:AcrR family transcriptional regulator
MSAPAPPAAADTVGTGRRAGLDRDDVVEAALALVEAGGAGALTMRKLAADLGVTTTTIYWHVGGRDELVTAIIQRMSERQAEAAIAGDTARERVMSAARHVWTSALEHRHITSLAHQSGASSLLQIHLEQALVRELDAAGVKGEQARDALRGILLCVGGFLVMGLRGRRDDDDTLPAARSSQALWAEVDDPAIDRSTVEALSAPLDLPALFETTVQGVVDSFVPEQ